MPSLIKKRGKKRWRAAIMVNGQKKEKLFKDSSKAEYRAAVSWEKEEKERLKAEQTTMDCLTIFDWAQDYLDYSQSNFGAKTYGEKRGAFKKLFKFESINVDSEIDSLTPSVAMKHLMEQAKDRSGNASNKDRKNLAAGWEWGRKYISGFPQQVLNPFRAVDKFPEIRHPRYVPPEEDFWQAYKKAEDQDQVLLLAYLHLAARRNEVFNLKWEDIDFGNAQLRLWTRKRKGEKVFHWLPMTSELRTALKRWWEKRPIKSTPYVFVCLDTKPCCEPYYGKPFKERRHFMEALCKKAGVKHFGFHAIRHLTASILYHKGYDTSVIQSILRHKSPTTTNRYLRKLGLKETREALEKGLAGPGTIVPFEKKRASAG